MLLTALTLGHRFGVISILARSVPRHLRYIAAMGLGQRLAGALPEPLLAMPVRSGFAYKKRKDRREYVRVTLRATPSGEIEAVKYPKDGAGIITSLTETDGLVELGEDVTAVVPGTTVGFLSYAAITN